MHPDIGLVIIGDELLSAKRRDKHLENAVRLLGERGLELSWVRIERDDLARLAAVFRETLHGAGLVFSLGGIGATPDDVTRPAAAQAAGVPLIRHPEVVRLLETQFGEATYPNRIRMAAVPQGAALIPNPSGLIPGFSLADHHFLPGFPDMAAAMLGWILDERYAALRRAPAVEQLLEVYDVPESELVPIMERLLAACPGIRLSSLPRHGRPWRVEIGLKGSEPAVEAAQNEFTRELNRSGITWRQGIRLDPGHPIPPGRDDTPRAEK